MVFRRAFVRFAYERLAALALAALVPAAVFAQPAPTAVPPLSANAILARVKAQVRTRSVPPFVVYTLVRRDELDGVPDFADSYTLRIWCRTDDPAALARRMFGARIVGPPQFIEPAFDAPVDPGPPTSDLLDVIRQTSGAPHAPDEQASPLPSALPVIGGVTVFIERNYRVSLRGSDPNDYHLELVALHDPERYRLTDLFIDRTTFAIHRAVARDRLYFPDGETLPERFEIEFGTAGGVPVIVAIHGASDPLAARAQSLRSHDVDYSYEDFAFPAALPDWYFAPATYGAHRDEFPSS